MAILAEGKMSWLLPRFMGRTTVGARLDSKGTTVAYGLHFVVATIDGTDGKGKLLKMTTGTPTQCLTGAQVSVV